MWDVPLGDLGAPHPHTRILGPTVVACNHVPRILGILLPVHVANSIHRSPPWGEGHLTCGVATCPVVRSSRVS